MGKFTNIHLFVKKIPENLFTKQNFQKIQLVIKKIIKIANQSKYNLNFDISCSQFLDKKFKYQITKHKNLPNKSELNSDLIIIIGGDGSMLKSIRENINNDIPILGINQGRLGFLTDLNIDKLSVNLEKILKGNYIQEKRSLLQATIKKSNHKKPTHIKYHAVNEIVLYNDKIPKLIEFQIYINGKFILQQRADGLVIATPTGSTAYSLSAGGPILDPKLKVITLVPLYPHTLSSRPIVINEDSIIELKIINQNLNIEYGLNFDGQKNISLNIEDQIIITKHPKEFNLIHPTDYNYFSILREKLGWNN